VRWERLAGSCGMALAPDGVGQPAEDSEQLVPLWAAPQQRRPPGRKEVPGGCPPCSDLCPHLQQLRLGVLPAAHAHLAGGQAVVQAHRPGELVPQLLENIEGFLHLGASLHGATRACSCGLGGGRQG
jgi:hypothetical protein